MDKIYRFYPFVYCIYLFGQCHCGFWLFCCCKTFWNNRNHLAKWRSPCVSLKIITHLRTFVSQSDSSIQRPRSIKKKQDVVCSYCHTKSRWRSKTLYTHTKKVGMPHSKERDFSMLFYIMDTNSLSTSLHLYFECDSLAKKRENTKERKLKLNLTGSIFLNTFP